MTRFRRALITGASSGIGEAIAARLARDACDLVLVARRHDRLTELGERLRADHGVTAEAHPADLCDADDLEAVARRIAAEPPIDLVVNNAGFGTQGRFWQLDWAGEAREVQLNVVAPHRLMHAALGAMVPRGEGAVMNISSMGSFQAVPTLGTYGATKAFVTSLSEAVHEELRGTGVTVTAVCPGFTRTEFQQTLGVSESAGLPGLVWGSADACAEAAVQATAAGRAVVVPGLMNKMASHATAPIPSALKRRVIGLGSSLVE